MKLPGGVQWLTGHAREPGGVTSLPLHREEGRVWSDWLASLGGNQTFSLLAQGLLCCGRVQLLRGAFRGRAQDCQANPVGVGAQQALL